MPEETPANQGKTLGNNIQARPGEIEVDLGRGVKLTMVPIAAGEFLMGSPDSDKNASKDETPRHRVRITRPFYLGKYPVTQEQWEAVTGNNPSNVLEPKSPVVNVSWEDCRQFCDMLNAKPHAAGKFQLPTEAQWEYACRAGSTTSYCFGSEESRLGDFAWYAANAQLQAHSIGTKLPNVWGLYDMHGNVWQWCLDWYDRGYYANSPKDDPMGPATGPGRVFRGGGWDYPAASCRSAYRSEAEPDCRNYDLGLRVCLIPAEK